MNFGALSIGSGNPQLNVQATGATNAYSLTFGTTILNGNAVFDLSKGGTPMGSLTLGALNDNNTANTITVQDNGTLILGSAAASLVNGSAVNINGSAILNSNNAAALGQYAAVTVNSNAANAFGIGASQTIGSLAGSGQVSLNANTLTVGNTNNLTAAFSGVLSNGSGTGPWSRPARAR